MSAFSRMPLQGWTLALSAFAIGTAEFVIAGILTNVAETLRIIVGTVVDSHLGAAAIPFAAAIVPVVGLLFILTRERRLALAPKLA